MLYTNIISNIVLIKLVIIFDSGFSLTNQKRAPINLSTMENFVYIITDSNRTNLHVGMSTDLSGTLDKYRLAAASFFNRKEQLTRLVYVQRFNTEKQALNYLELISGYTRMQRERLVRSCNPNWHNLTSASDFNHLVISGANPHVQRSAHLVP